MTGPFYISYAALWIVVTFQTLVLLGLLRSHARASESSHMHEPQFDDSLRGTRIPAFTARDVSGAVVDESLIIGRRTALLFVSPTCSTCSATLEELQALEQKSNGGVLVVCQAASADCLALSTRYGIDASVIVDADREISQLLGVNGAPTAVIVSESGIIESYGHPMRGPDLENLLVSR